MSDKEFESYIRIHNYLNPSDVEKGKIKKETKNHIKHREKSKKLTKDMLRNIRNLSDFDEFLAEEVELENENSKKEKGNANTHKKRLKKLDKIEDFN